MRKIEIPLKAEEVISYLGLAPHPEGGYFKETYQSDDKIPADGLPSRYGAERHISTAIYYMITRDNFSAIHRVLSDEVYHYYLGDSVMMLLLYPDGHGEKVILGRDITRGQHPQFLVPRGVWQGICLVEGGSFGLMGTTVAPGFDFRDFEFGNRQELLEKYPEYAVLIQRLANE